MIEVKNLVKRYGDHNAVDHLSFTVEDGQIFGFLGPNGAGKSTTMNIMTGYLAATEGDVVIEGHNVLDEPEEAKACVGYLPEMPPLYPDMTVVEYLRFVAELKKLGKAERENQIGQILALTHLEDMSNRLIRNLSKGYRQRVGLAQAILGFPKIIILDEPTVGLDPKQVVEIRDLIRHLSKEHTVLISSHILSEIRAVCDHVLIIRKGKFVACDTPENLEEMLSSNDQVELLVKGSQETADRVLSSVPGVEGYGYTDHTDDTVRVQLVTSQDVREALFFAFAKANCPLLELKPQTASLEDVFLDLTDEDDNVATKAAQLLNRNIHVPEPAPKREDAFSGDGPADVPFAAPTSYLSGAQEPQATPEKNVGSADVPFAAPTSYLGGEQEPQAMPEKNAGSAGVPFAAPTSALSGEQEPQATPERNAASAGVPFAAPTSALSGALEPQAMPEKNAGSAGVPFAAPTSALSGEQDPQATPDKEEGKKEKHDESDL